jgi:hypothetical protein
MSGDKSAMIDRRLNAEDKEKMFNAHKGMWSNFALSVLALFANGEEITTKELSEKSKETNAGHRFKESAINKVLANELKEKVIPCGKNRWKLRNFGLCGGNHAYVS